MHFSAFVACMKHSKQEVMMQEKLGDCASTFLFFLSTFKVLSGVSLAGKSQTSRFNTHKYTHSLIPQRVVLYPTSLALGYVVFLFTVYMHTFIHTHTHTHTHIHASACTQPSIHT